MAWCPIALFSSHIVSPKLVGSVSFFVFYFALLILVCCLLVFVLALFYFELVYEIFCLMLWIRKYFVADTDHSFLSDTDPDPTF